MTEPPIRVCALYRFARFDDPGRIRDTLHERCEHEDVRGTLLVAAEGINGTIAGAPASIERVVACVRALPGCAELSVKWAETEAMPFHRLKVRVKREIVTMGESVDPLRSVGTYVAPEDWNALIGDPDTVLIDTRNAYEVKVGTFRGAIDPGTDSFRDFPAWFRANAPAWEGRKVAMFCTGGIRCEKATALLKAEGVADVFHLDGGILRYLETVPASDSRWDGECFVFDERVAVGHALAAGTHTLCRGCRMPVSEADRASPLYEDGVACPACHDHRDAEARASAAERHRQVALAAARGETHVGRRHDPPGR